MVWLSTAEVAVLLKMTPQGLQKWRREKRGPPYTRLEGKISYRKDDLLRWIEKNTVQPKE